MTLYIFSLITFFFGHLLFSVMLTHYTHAYSISRELMLLLVASVGAAWACRVSTLWFELSSYAFLKAKFNIYIRRCHRFTFIVFIEESMINSIEDQIFWVQFSYLFIPLLFSTTLIVSPDRPSCMAHQRAALLCVIVRAILRC